MDAIYVSVSTASQKAQWSRLVGRSSHVGAGVSEELQREEPRRSTASGGQTESQCGERRLLWSPSDVPHIILQVSFIANCRSNNDWSRPSRFQIFLVVNRVRSSVTLIGQLLVLTRPLGHILFLIGCFLRHSWQNISVSLYSYMLIWRTRLINNSTSWKIYQLYYNLIILNQNQCYIKRQLD